MKHYDYVVYHPTKDILGYMFRDAPDGWWIESELGHHFYFSAIEIKQAGFVKVASLRGVK